MGELAFVFPAAGAIAVSLLRRHPSAGLVAGAAGLAGLLAAVVVATGGIDTAIAPAIALRWGAPARAMLLASGLSGALAVIFVPPGGDRLPLLASVLAGLAALAAASVLADPILVAVVLVLLAAFHAALPGFASFASRVRAPLYGALLILFGSLAAAGPAGASLGRLAGLAMVLGVTAVVGVAPYLRKLDPREPTPASPLAWLGFLGPGLAVLLVTRLAAGLPQEAGPGYAAALLGLGILNLAIGAAGAWQAAAPVDLWRHSFVADWGLILVAFGLLNATASSAAYLLMIGILLFRLPLYLLCRPALVRAEPLARPGLFTIILAAALAGGAPFAGFPARLLLLRGSSQVAWPVALLLVLAMLAWLPLSVSLARTIGRPTGRMLFAVGLLLLVNLVLGLYPGPVLALFGQPDVH